MQRRANQPATDRSGRYGPASVRLSAPGVLAVAAVHIAGLALLASADGLALNVPTRTVMVAMVAPAAPARPQAATAEPQRPAQQRPMPTRTAPAPRPPSQPIAVPSTAANSPLSSTAPSAAAEAPAVKESNPAASLAAPPAPTEPSRPAAAPPTLSAPRFDAGYLRNPAPVYPEQSRRFGEQGTVVLRVFVEPTGRPSRIEIKAGSGSSRLDAAAQEAVARWQFVAARLGEEAVGAWVIVPIVFNLKG